MRSSACVGKRVSYQDNKYHFLCARRMIFWRVQKVKVLFDCHYFWKFDDIKVFNLGNSNILINQNLYRRVRFFGQVRQRQKPPYAEALEYESVFRDSQGARLPLGR